ncbi:YqhA family protein [Bosea thiooxidans]
MNSARSRRTTAIADHHPPESNPPFAERVIERAILGSRWILVAFHTGLLLTIIILLVKFFHVAWTTLISVARLSVKEVVVASLSIIELALIASLILMVIFSSYEGFVSRLDRHGDQRGGSELRSIGFGTLKHRLMASIATIAGVYLLETVMQCARR